STGASSSPPREFKTFSAGDLKTSSPDQIRGSILSDIGVSSGGAVDEETYNTKLGGWASQASAEDKTRFTDTMTKNMKTLNVEKDAGRIGREDGYRDKAKIFHTDTFRKFQNEAPKSAEAPKPAETAPLAIGVGQQPADFTKKLQEEQMKRMEQERNQQKAA
ncbi:MAG: hypothetical protein Q7R79_04250, partial [bacterium]|nr:hypothetical protein [bacterium]